MQTCACVKIGVPKKKKKAWTAGFKPARAKPT